MVPMSESAKEVRLPELDDQCFLELSELRADGTDNIDRERTVHHCRERQLRSALRQFHTALQYLDQKDARIDSLMSEVNDCCMANGEKDARIAELERIASTGSFYPPYKAAIERAEAAEAALAAEKARHDVTQKALERLSMSIITKAGLGNLLHTREGGKP